MKDNVILITGGTTGIGLGAAKFLQAQGARVIVTGRNPETLAAARTELGPEAVVLPSDASSVADAQNLGKLVSEHTSRLHGLFLNAGVAAFIPFEQVTPEQFDSMFDVNVRGLFFQFQSLLPLLANPSSVVLNASVAGFLTTQGTSVYGPTKAAVAALGRILSVELAPRGIRVNAISPGPIKTPIFGKTGASAEEARKIEETLASKTLLKRLGTPEELAHLVKFLLSPESSFIIGEEIVIDGGRQRV